MSLSERLQQLREQLDMPQKELAALIGVSRSTLASWESGHRKPELAHMEAIGKIGNVSIDWLLGGSVKFANQLRTLRNSRGLTQKDLAKLMSLSPSTVAMYETGDREPDFEVVTKIAQFFDVSTDFLLTGGTADRQHRAAHPLRQKVEMEFVPVLGRIRAGIPLLSEEHIMRYIEAPVHITNRSDFALEVAGDSMIGAGLHAGDVVFMRLARKRPPIHGDIVAAMVDQGDMTLKRYIKKNGEHVLRAENSAYKDIAVTDGVEIQGVYVARYSEYQGNVDPPLEDMTEDELITKLAKLRGIDPDQVAGMLDVLGKRKRR